MHTARFAIFLFVIGSLAACGGGEDASAPSADAVSTPASAPVATAVAPTPIPTVAATPTAVEVVEPVATASPEDLGFSAEEIEQVRLILATPEGREQVINGLLFETSMTLDEATCFFDNTEIDSMIAMVGDAPLVGNVDIDVRGSFLVCDIDMGILQEL